MSDAAVSWPDKAFIMRKSFLIRISPDLWDELNRWAAEDLRSVNGQIEFLLRQAVVARRRRRPDAAAPPADETTPDNPASL